MLNLDLLLKNRANRIVSLYCYCLALYFKFSFYVLPHSLCAPKMCASATVAPMAQSQSTYRVGVGRLARHSAHIPRSSSLDGIGLNKTKEVSVLKVLVGKLVEGSDNASPFFLGHSVKAPSSTQAVGASFPGFHDLPSCWGRILLTPVPFRFGHCSLPRIGIPRSLPGSSRCRVARPIRGTAVADGPECQSDSGLNTQSAWARQLVWGRHHRRTKPVKSHKTLTRSEIYCACASICDL